MKERPILLNAEMVRAVLDGRKTQTRRMVANVDSDNCLALRKPTKTRNGIYTHVMDAPKHNLCPFGAVGDRLWVRETWQGPLVSYDDAYSIFKDPKPYQKVENCVYRADGGPCPEFTDADDELRQGWRPSIHMPRWASRITLEITGVRVERLQDISDSDAKAEGCWYGRGCGEPDFAVSPADHFPTLWASIYREKSWQANPWVWVIEFKRLDNADKAG
ncbi:hypothetical protein [Pantoea stewartii]|uniref:hypothetical protein n=1 Tax=Pantoea stewartii TaxID=66269 RepID=UPI00162595DA|nr:hypothetical protein [Pantoea stewartii]MBC0853840.1 hypothetical protein [Pantoea stewartii]